MEKGVDEGRIGGSGCVAQAQGQGQLRRFVAGRVLRQLSRHFLLVISSLDIRNPCLDGRALSLSYIYFLDSP